MTFNDNSNNTKEPGIVLISGYKRSGKDTIAKMMKELIEDGTSDKVEILSFAEPLKQMIANIFGISLIELDEFKNNPVNNQLYMLTGFQHYESFTDFRELHTKTADAMKSIFGNDVFVKILKEKIAKSDADVIIVPDFRFLIEDAFGGIDNCVKIRIVNDKIINNSTHPSETELENFSFDIYLDNTDYRLTKEILKKEMIEKTLKLEKEGKNA